MYNIICTTPIKHLPDVSKELRKHGNVKYFPLINAKKLKDKLLKGKFNVIFCNPNKQGYILDKSILENSNIKLINTCSTGTNHIDLSYCKKNKIKVYSLAENKSFIKNLPSTSELAFGLMINVLRKVHQSYESVKKNKWDYLPYVGRQIKGLNICVIGYGRLGKIFCKQLIGFGVNVFVVDPYVKKCRYKKLPLTKAMAKADVIAIHVHLNHATKNLINKHNISKCKKNAIIINTSRGEIVNEKDIILAIKKNKLGGYGTDVLSNELNGLNRNPVIKAAKQGLPVLITPHIGGMTIEGQTKAYLFAAKKLKKIALR